MIKKLLFFAVVVLISKSITAQVWTQQNTNFTDLSTAIGVDQVSVVDENIVWVRGSNGSSSGGALKVFSRTNDGGTTWTAGHFTQLGADEWTYVLAASSYDKAYVVVMDSLDDGTSFWGTADGGTTWVQKTSMFNEAGSFVDGVRFWDAQNGFSYGDPTGGMYEIYTTADGGTTWTRNQAAPTPVPASEYGLNGFECSATVPGGVAFIISDHGRVFKTPDYGTTWSVLPTAPFASAAYGSVKVYASSENYIICAAYTTATTTWSWKYTTNGGTSWSTYTPTGPFYEYAMCYVPGSVNTFVATSPYTALSGVAYSTDGGLSFTDYIDPLLQVNTANVQCLGVGYATPQTGWVGNYDINGTINSILKYYDPSVGINVFNTVNGNDVNIYPNPSNGIVNFSVNGPNNDDISIKVYDVVGQLIFSENMNVNSLQNTSYNFSSYAKGLYMVQILSGKDLTTQKFVIQ